jgi:hypothetical protein
MVWFGLVVMIVSETATLLQIEPFWSWNTPIVWTGFIVFADDVVWRARHDSWLRSNPREFALLAAVSIPLWLVFEGYNRVLNNWFYVGLPDNWVARQFGYAWSFATIWPAIFEGADLASVWRHRNRGHSGLQSRAERNASPVAAPGFSPAAWLSIIAGALMLAVPFVVPPPIARYLAAPVWLGFILLLDPINGRLGGETLFRNGRFDRVKNLALSGLLCGVLWEFWNYWSRAKWHYTVPIMEQVKVFEMPLPGYLGFPAFALECFTMYVFVRSLAVRLQPAATRHSAGRPIAL